MVGVETVRVKAAAKAVTKEASTATAAAAAAAAATTTAQKAAALTAEDDDDDKRLVGRISVTSISMGSNKNKQKFLVPNLICVLFDDLCTTRLEMYNVYTSSLLSSHNS